MQTVPAGCKYVYTRTTMHTFAYDYKCEKPHSNRERLFKPHLNCIYI